MTDRVFFYGTLMTGFDRRRRAGIDPMLERVGRGRITAALFDLGIYPAAVPDPDGVVWGEVYRANDIEKVLAGLDEIEGHSPAMPEVEPLQPHRGPRRLRRWLDRRRVGVPLQRPARPRGADRIGRLPGALARQVAISFPALLPLVTEDLCCEPSAHLVFACSS